MKSLKLFIGSSLMLPTAVVPATLTSCSVYKNLLDGYTPSYEQLDGKEITAEQAATYWFNKAKEISNFGEQEFYKCNADAAKLKYEGQVSSSFPGLTYSSEYTTYYVNISYFNVDSSTHKISYKITANIDEKNTYKYNGTKAGTGVTHYTLEYEIQNVLFDAAIEKDDSITSTTHMLIKPTIFKYSDENGWYWSEGLSDDNKVTFNLRYVVEIYNTEDIQSYGYEATEAAILDKDHSYLPELEDILNYFCCFWSYYLGKCTLKN